MRDYDELFKGCEYALVQTSNQDGAQFHVLKNYKEVGKIYVHSFTRWEGEFDTNTKLSELLDGEMLDIKFMKKYDKEDR